MGAVYMLCYGRSLSGKGNSHYLGYAESDTERRIKQHRKGKAGAAFTTEAYRQGIPFEVANIWPDMGKDDERQIKRSKNHARYCRLCSGRVWTMPRPRRVRHAPKQRQEGHTETIGAQAGTESDIETGSLLSDPTHGRMRHMLTANLIGNIGGDPELRYTAQGQAVLTFNVAHNYSERNQAGEFEQRVEWVRVSLFGERGEKLKEHLVKGQRVYVFGRLKARPWTDDSKNVRAGIEIVAADVEFAGERPEGGNGSTYNPPASGQPAKPRPTATAGAATGTRAPASSGGGGRRPVDDSDLPF